LRLLQGLALGGEWAGSALLVAEYAPAAKRGRYGMVSPVGAGVGLVLANLALLGVGFTIGDKSAAFMNWGWRVPFLFSAVLIGVALYVRLNIAETPVFTAHRELADRRGAPFAELFRAQRRQVLLASGAAVGPFTVSFMAGTYLMNYARVELSHPKNLILFVGVLGGISLIVFNALAGGWSDTYGRRRVMLCGFALAVPWSFAVMPLLDTRSPALFGLAIVVMYALLGMMTGPMAAFIPEIFATRYRYTGAGLAFNAGGIVGGAVPPLVAGALVASVGGWAVGLMMAALVLLSLSCTARLPETAGTALTHTGIE
jgi:MFS family permease